MSSKYQKTNFYFNSIIWHEIPRRRGISVVEVGDILSRNIALSKYGNSVKQINFISIIVTSNNKVHENNYCYVADKQEFNAEVRLDYHAAFAVKDDEHAFKAFIANAFLQAIEQLQSLEVKDFDFDQLKADLENLFEAQGWLIPA